MQSKKTSKFVFGAVIVVLVAIFVGGGVYFWQQKSSNPNETTYKSPAFNFQISKPLNTVVRENKSVEDFQTKFGRVGMVSFKDSSKTTNSNPDVIIFVYSSKDKLEKDFSSGGDSTTDATMTSLGLKKTQMTISGKEAVVYSGTHIVDSPGAGGPGWPYVVAEIVGPTYSYMIEFNNVSTDPKDAVISGYLNSFVAK